MSKIILLTFRTVLTVFLFVYSVCFVDAAQLLQGLEVQIVDPVTNFQILPDTKNIPSTLSDKILVVGAPGEFEPAGVVFTSAMDIGGFNLRISDLKNNAGDSIPSSHADIKIVKCWYQSGTQKGRGATPNNEGVRLLTPELLLYDEDLVKVDTVKKDNYLRCIDPDTGQVEYVCVSEPILRVDHDTLKKMDKGFKDSKTLQPVTLLKGENKQYWLTFHIPDRALPGVYKGNLEVLFGQDVKATVPIELRVLPFTLPTPTTYYNPDHEFVLSMYYWGELSRDNKTRLGGRERSLKQFRHELQNMYDHGVTNPITLWGERLLFHDDAALRTYFQMREDVGIKGSLFISEGRSKILADDKAGIKRFQHYVKKVLNIAKDYGIDDVYFYGIDEATGETLVNQRALWKGIHEVGGKVFGSGYVGSNFKEMGDIQDLLICAGPLSKEEADRWHGNGHKIFSYANPQGGLEAPYSYRENYGIKLWKHNYDGAATFCYMEPGAYGIWHDFLKDTSGKCRPLMMAYPTIDGVIDTVQWEGYREGIDDIRYICRLREEISRAMNSKNTKARNLANVAKRYIDRLDDKKDLALVRAEIIDYILKIQNELLVGSSDVKPNKYEKRKVAVSWEFNEGHGDIAKSSPNPGYNMDVIGATWQKNQTGFELVFNGTGNYAELPDIDKLNFGTGDFTVSFWVKPNKDKLGDIVSKWCYYNYGNKPAEGYRIFLRKAGQNAQLVFCVGNGTHPGAITAVNADNLYDGEFHHVACTKNKDTLTIYIDGESVRTLKSDNLNASSAVHFIVGRYGSSVGSSLFAGSLDRLAVHNYCLDGQQIKKDYQSAKRSY